MLARNRAAREWADRDRLAAVEAAVSDADRVEGWAASDRENLRKVGGLLRRIRAGGIVHVGDTTAPPGAMMLAGAGGRGALIEVDGVRAAVVAGEFEANPSRPAGGRWLMEIEERPDGEPARRVLAPGDGQSFRSEGGRLEIKTGPARIFGPDGRGWRPADPLPLIVEALDRALTADDGLSALAVIVEGLPVPAVSGRPDPILPALTLAAPGPERERGGRLLGGLVPDGAAPDGHLPLLPEVAADRARADALTRVPLLELADAAGVESMAAGRGAPLDLRLTVEALLSVDVELRRRPAVDIAWTVGELMRAMFPNRYYMTRPGERPGDWERMRRALLSAGERWVPWLNGGRWWLLRVRGEPGPAPAQSDPVVVSVALPPGAESGPVIDRAALRAAGVRSAPEYRARIAIPTVAWHLGRTLKPVRGGKHWVWRGAADRYPVATLADRRRMIFGAGSTHSDPRVDREFEKATRDAGCEILDKNAVDLAGRRGWLAVPAEAARAIRAARARAERDREIRRRLADGQSAKAVAEAVGCTLATVGRAAMKGGG